MLFAKGMEAEKRDEMFFARDGLDGFMSRETSETEKVYEKDDTMIPKCPQWKHGRMEGRFLF